MKAIDSRIRRLQQRLCPDSGHEQRLWVLIRPSYGLALDPDRCVDILGECRFLPQSRFGCLNFLRIPQDLNAKELEQYLRKNGASICRQGGDQKQEWPEGGNRSGDSRGQDCAQMSAGVLR